MKSALIVSPYLDHLGGGERYMLTAARVLAEAGYRLSFAWESASDIERIARELNIALGSFTLDVRAKQAYFQTGLAMYWATKPYDVVLYLSDGSLPWLGGKKNLIHFQVPFHGVRGRSLTNRLKERLITAYIVNSEFTKKVIDREYGVRSTVVYPPVVPIKGSPKKAPYILSVGRFDHSLNLKKQDVLIRAFARLEPELPGWKLILAGGTADPAWVEQLRSSARGLPIEILSNVSHAKLTQLYQHATIYWHAAGYDVDEVTHPELTEHFGISTVEAISAGAVPLVVPRGGQKEIIPIEELTWQTIPELVSKTKQLVSDDARQRYLTELPIREYEVSQFYAKLSEVIA
jgi:glycosyltransferase involved in cell wall biosynthesis